jgi:hypothetical protein
MINIQKDSWHLAINILKNKQGNFPSVFAWKGTTLQNLLYFCTLFQRGQYAGRKFVFGL